jgi:UDP-N-acetylmuramate dehydrogenase
MHALVLVNHGGATASEVIEFASMIQERVYGMLGIMLRPEVQLIGKLPPLKYEN